MATLADAIRTIGRCEMKSVLTGIALMIVISVAAWGVAQTQSTSSADAFSSSDSVRLH
jgi:hypothetical protein